MLSFHHYFIIHCTFDFTNSSDCYLKRVHRHSAHVIQAVVYCKLSDNPVRIRNKWYGIQAADVRLAVFPFTADRVCRSCENKFLQIIVHSWRCSLLIKYGNSQSHVTTLVTVSDQHKVVRKLKLLIWTDRQLCSETKQSALALFSLDAGQGFETMWQYIECDFTWNDNSGLHSNHNVPKFSAMPSQHTINRCSFCIIHGSVVITMWFRVLGQM